MKVIDLLNKIANGDEVPQKIKWEDIIYAYNEYDKDYLEYPFSDEEYKGLFNMKDSILTQFLNDKVEIVEDKKEHKIEKLNTWYSVDIKDDRESNMEYANYNFEYYYDKINELIDKVNEMSDKE